MKGKKKQTSFDKDAIVKHFTDWKKEYKMGAKYLVGLLTAYGARAYINSENNIVVNFILDQIEDAVGLRDRKDEPEEMGEIRSVGRGLGDKVKTHLTKYKREYASGLLGLLLGMGIRAVVNSQGNIEVEEDDGTEIEIIPNPIVLKSFEPLYMELEFDEDDGRAETTEGYAEVRYADNPHNVRVSRPRPVGLLDGKITQKDLHTIRS